jgi:hypothetical protein
MDLYAVTIVLRTGKTINVDHYSEEADRIWIDLHGLKASIPLSDIKQIDDKLYSPKPISSPTASKNISKPVNSPPKPSKTDTLQDQNRPQIKKTSKTPDALDNSLDSKVYPGNPLHQNGFGDLNWGDKFSSHSGFELAKADTGLEGVKEFYRPAEKLEIGEINFKSVTYGFWEDQFYTTTVWTQGLENYKALQKAAFDRFGTGTKADPSREIYYWTDTLADRMLEYTDDGQYGMLWMRSKSINKQVNISRLDGPIQYLKKMRTK